MSVFNKESPKSQNSQEDAATKIWIELKNILNDSKPVLKQIEPNSSTIVPWDSYNISLPVPANISNIYKYQSTDLEWNEHCSWNNNYRRRTNRVNESCRYNADRQHNDNYSERVLTMLPNPRKKGPKYRRGNQFNRG